MQSDHEPSAVPGRHRSRRPTVIAAVAAVLVVTIPLAVHLVGVKLAESPDNVVRDYLGALGRRDAVTARAQLSGAGTSGLLSAAAVRNPGYHPPRLVAVRTGSVTATTGTVDARYEVDGRPYDLRLALVRPRGVLLPHRWHIRGGLPSLPLPPAYFLSSTLTVAGTRVATDQTEIDGVFPGGYEIAAPASPIYLAPPLTVVAGASQEPRFTLTLRDSARTAITTQVRQYLENCAQALELAPAHCPFRAWVSIEGMTSLAWQIVTPPALTIQIDSDGTAVVTSGYGVVRSTQQGPPGTPPYVQNIEFTVSGKAQGDDGKVVFVPSDRPAIG